MFLKSDSVPWSSASLDRIRVSHVPRRHQYYQSTKTSGAYRRSAYLFASPFRLSPQRSLPCSRGIRTGPAPLSAAVPSAISQSVDAGSPRFLESPSHTSAPLSDPGRSKPSSPWRSIRYGPHVCDREDTSAQGISGLNHAASVSTAYASRDVLTTPHARLASGRWLALAGWESNPLGSIDEFPPYIASSPPRLTLARRKIPAEHTVRGSMARGFEGGARNFQSANAAYTAIREPHTRPIAVLTLPSLRPWRVTPQYAIAYVHK